MNQDSKTMGMDAHICLAVALSKVVKYPLKSIYDFLGHDGSEIVWPNNPEPYCRRGFHPQEIVDFCYMVVQRPATIIEANPKQISLNDLSKIYSTPIRNQQNRIKEYMNLGDGILCGLTEHNQYHAVAWINKEWDSIPINSIQLFMLIQ